MKKTRSAVIGCGNMGRHHVRLYSDLTSLCAISDISSAHGKSLADKYHTKFYKDYQEMLTNEKPDVVSVAVPTNLHYDVTLECLSRKIAVLVEKPIANTVKQGELLLENARKNRTFLMVGHVERFNPVVKKLKQIISQGRLGKILSLVAMRVGINPPPTKDSDVAMELAIHDVDVLNFIMDKVPNNKKIIRHKIFKDNLADSASIMLEYNGATALIQTNWITPIKMRKLYVTGIKGFAEVDYIDQRLTLYDKIILPKPEGDFYELVTLFKSPKKEIFVFKKEPLKQELLYFLKNYKTHDYKNVEDSIASLEILHI
mgnify:CR=1 FL=1